MERIEAHIFIAFLAYCIHVTLGRRLRDLAPELIPRSVLEKLGARQMLDVQLPPTDGRELILTRYTRYTQPEPDQRLILEQLKLSLPAQPRPKITSIQANPNLARVVQTFRTHSLICSHLQALEARIREVGLESCRELQANIARRFEVRRIDILDEIEVLLVHQVAYPQADRVECLAEFPFVADRGVDAEVLRRPPPRKIATRH